MQVVEPPKTDRYEAESLDWEGVEHLLDMVEDEVFRTLVLVALQTGLRRSELLGLQWRDVNFAGRQLSVRRAWVKVGRKDKRLEATKSGQSRVVDLPEESVEALLATRACDEDSGEQSYARARPVQRRLTGVAASGCVCSWRGVSSGRRPGRRWCRLPVGEHGPGVLRLHHW